MLHPNPKSPLPVQVNHASTIPKTRIRIITRVSQFIVSPSLPTDGLPVVQEEDDEDGLEFDELVPRGGTFGFTPQHEPVMGSQASCSPAGSVIGAISPQTGVANPPAYNPSLEQLYSTPFGRTVGHVSRLFARLLIRLVHGCLLRACSEHSVKPVPGHTTQSPMAKLLTGAPTLYMLGTRNVESQRKQHMLYLPDITWTTNP
jgi:hypothetical protein